MKNQNKKWKQIELGEIVDIFDSIRVPLNSRQRAERQGKYPYYGASGVIDSVDDYLFDGSYILVAEDGENLNSRKLPVAFMARGQFWVNNHAHIIKGKKGVASDRYLVAWFAQTDIKGYITGAAQPKLSQANLKRISLFLPPYSTQLKIASILSAYDDLIENNTRRIAILEEIARSIYREWFINFRFPGHEEVKLVDSPLGKIPEGWKVKPFGEISGVTMGTSPKGDTYNQEGIGTPLLNGPVEFADRFTKRVKWTTDPGKLCKKGDLIVCVRGSTTGKFVKSDGVYCLGRGVCSFSCKTQSYIDLLFQNQLPKLLAQTGGSTFPSWTGPQLKGHEVLWPPQAILDKFDALVSPTSDAIFSLTRISNNLKSTRDFLLPKLISGQLDIDELDIQVSETFAEATE